jgi:hypothetical protein
MSRDHVDPPPLPDGMARVYFFRPAKIWGAALRPRLILDGSPIGRVLAGKFFFKDIEPGVHEVKIRTEVKRKLQLKLRAGETQFVKVSVGFGWLIGRFQFELVAKDTAQDELSRISTVDDAFF